MEAAAEGLWVLAESHEQRGNIGQAIKCLEAVCQCQPAFLPLTEVKSRVRVAGLLLQHTTNVAQARYHLERAQLLLKQIPACFELKCRALSLLTRCYRLAGAYGPQKQTLKKGLELALSDEGQLPLRWACNFSLQMASALAEAGEFASALQSLESGLQCAGRAQHPELGLVFAASIVHVRLMDGQERPAVEEALAACDRLWSQIPDTEKAAHSWLWMYKELLYAFHLLRICEYKDATARVAGLETAVKEMAPAEQEDADMEWRLKQELQAVQEELAQSYYPHARKVELLERHQRLQAQLGVVTQRQASQTPEWLPRGMVRALVDLMSLVCLRPKGAFKECLGLFESGLTLVEKELVKLGIVNDEVTEGDLQPCSVYVAGVGLMVWMQLVENKIIIDLTRADFVAAQEALVRLVQCWSRFSVVLQTYECTIHMLLGQYAHAVGCPREAAAHFSRASRLAADRNGQQAMCQLYATLSHLCVGDPDHTSQAFDLLGPLSQDVESNLGVRERTLLLFLTGVLQMSQQNGQEARVRLAVGLKLTYRHLGNQQLVSQYLTVLGSIALSMHDMDGAEKILMSSLTLAKALYDLPAQIAIMDQFNLLFQELGDSVRQHENMEAQEQKRQQFLDRVRLAKASQHHVQLLRHGLVTEQELP